MSKHSPCTIEGSEQLARLVFSNTNVKKGYAKPAAFSHASSKGCSIQRDTVATEAELKTLIEKFTRQNNATWIGVMIGSCHAVRLLTGPDSNKRAVCVFDTANEDNPAHAELCQTEHVVEEADEQELRRNLLRIFGEGKIITPSEYRGGQLSRG